MVVIDTDVFVLAFAFHRDARQATNNQFLQIARSHDPAIAIFSVMELLGQLSFNLSAERLTQWSSWLQDSFGLSVLYPGTVNRLAEEFFQAELIDRPLARMTGHPIPYLDSIILDFWWKQQRGSKPLSPGTRAIIRDARRCGWSRRRNLSSFRGHRQTGFL